MANHLERLYKKEIIGELKQGLDSLQREAIKRVSWFIQSDDWQVDLSKIHVTSGYSQSRLSTLYFIYNELSYAVEYTGSEKSRIRVISIRCDSSSADGIYSVSVARDDLLPHEISFDLFGVKGARWKPSTEEKFTKALEIHSGIEPYSEINYRGKFSCYSDFIERGKFCENWTKEDIEMVISLSKLL